MTDPHPELPVDPDSVPPLHLRWSSIGLVFGGGLAGTAVRLWLGLLWPAHPGHWPTATFVVNVVGAFVLGTLLEGLLGERRAKWRLLLGTGFCGALTTYSTYATDVDLAVRAHAPGLAAAYAVVSLAAGLLATFAGIAAVSRMRA